VLWAWIWCKESLDPLYVFFLDRHGEKPRAVIDAVRDMQVGAITAITAPSDGTL
jgi:hypothetical protein